MKVSIDESQIDLLLRYAEIVDVVRPILEQECISCGFGTHYNNCKSALGLILAAADVRTPNGSEEYPIARQICNRK